AAAGGPSVCESGCGGLQPARPHAVRLPARDHQVTSGTAVIDRQSQPVVAELVDNTHPSDPTNPDLLRFSFDGAIVPDPNNPGCYLPELAPVAIKAGDLSVV